MCVAVWARIAGDVSCRVGPDCRRYVLDEDPGSAEELLTQVTTWRRCTTSRPPSNPYRPRSLLLTPPPHARPGPSLPNLLAQGGGQLSKDLFQNASSWLEGRSGWSPEKLPVAHPPKQGQLPPPAPARSCTTQAPALRRSTTMLMTQVRIVCADPLTSRPGWQWLCSHPCPAPCIPPCTHAATGGRWCVRVRVCVRARVCV